MKRSKVFIAGLLAGSMMLSQPAPVLAQELPADFEEILLDDYEVIPESMEIPEEDDTSLEEAEIEEIALETGAADTAGVVLSVEQKAYKANVISNVGELDFDNLTEGVDYEAGEVFAPAYTLEEARAIADAYGAGIKSLGYGIVVLDLSDTDYTVETAYCAGIDRVNMPAVEPNYITPVPEPEVEDEDAEFSSYGWDRSYYEWEYDDPALNPDNGDIYQWQHNMINTYAAWGITQGSPDITVAVIDSGVNAAHEDFSGRVKLADDIKFSFDHDDDRVGHGTHVAGIIGASVGNDLGGAGIAPKVTILAINASTTKDEKRYYFSLADEARSINYVAGYSTSVEENEDGDITYYHAEKDRDRRADIVNMSIGGDGFVQAVQDAVTNAKNAGVSVVVSMGNSFSNYRQYPAGYDGVIAVASVNEAGAKSNFSNYGDWCVIAAPGSNIYSTYRDYSGDPENNSAYKVMSGTSMSTPVVSGACALYMSAFGHVSPDKMREVLLASGNKTKDKGLGAGILDLTKMFGIDLSAPKIIFTDATGKQIAEASGNSVTVPGTLSANTKVSFVPTCFDGKDENLKNARIVYTTDGKNPAMVNGEITYGSYFDYDPEEENELTLSIINWLETDSKKAKTLTLKAAVVTGSGALSKVSTIKYTLEPVISYEFEDLDVVGPSNIAAGTTASYKVVTSIAGFGKKGITWTIDSDSAAKGIKIDSKKGKVTVPANVTEGTITIKATSNYVKITSTTYVTIIPGNVSTIKVVPDEGKAFNNIKYNKKTGSLESITLFTTNIDGEEFEGNETEFGYETQFFTKNNTRIDPDFSFESSNERVVTTGGLRDKQFLYAKGSGTATITIKPLDGSKKKTSFKVNVITPASGIALTTKNNQLNYIGYGKSATVIAALGNAYGKPTVNKVEWSYDILGVGYDEYDHVVYSDPVSEEVKKAIIKAKAFSFSKGKVTAGKEYDYYGACNKYCPAGYIDLAFVAKATTTDGTGYTASILFETAQPHTLMYICGSDGMPISSDKYSVSEIGKTGSYYIAYPGYSLSSFDVYSSKSSVATGRSYIDDDGWVRLAVTPHAKGTTTIKVKALDGSGVTTSIKITVK